MVSITTCPNHLPIPCLPPSVFLSILLQLKAHAQGRFRNYIIDALDYWYCLWVAIGAIGASTFLFQRTGHCSLRSNWIFAHALHLCHGACMDLTLTNHMKYLPCDGGLHVDMFRHMLRLHRPHQKVKPAHLNQKTIIRQPQVRASGHGGLSRRFLVPLTLDPLFYGYQRERERKKEKRRRDKNYMFI